MPRPESTLQGGFVGLALATFVVVLVLTTEGLAGAAVWTVPLLPVWIAVSLLQARCASPRKVYLVGVGVAVTVLYLLVTVGVFWDYQASSGMGYFFLWAGALCVTLVVTLVLGLVGWALHRTARRDAP